MTSMDLLWISLVGGAVAFAHCLGMCGGFALHLTAGASRRTVLVRQLLWHTGRILTYVFLGALAGFAGGFLHRLMQAAWLQDLLTYTLGGLMILAGVVLLGLLPTGRRTLDRPTSPLAWVMSQFFRQPSASAALAMGLLTGLLPCPIIWGFLPLAASTHSVLQGMGVMAAMGVGTCWSLLALGLTGHALATRIRKVGPILTAAVLILLGTATILRGTSAFHSLLGCPAMANPSAPPPPPSCPCCKP